MDELEVKGEGLNGSARALGGSKGGMARCYCVGIESLSYGTGTAKLKWTKSDAHSPQPTQQLGYDMDYTAQAAAELKSSVQGNATGNPLPRLHSNHTTNRDRIAQPLLPIELQPDRINSKHTEEYNNRICNTTLTKTPKKAGYALTSRDVSKRDVMKGACLNL